MRKRKENKIKISQIIKTFKEKKYKIKLNMIYMFLFYDIILNIIFFSLFIKCNHKKIISASSYINVKIRGTDEINVYSKLYYGNKPNIIIINNKINYTNSAINHTYNLDNANNDINNITLIWNNPLTFTVNLFRDCLNITEIDFSNFDSFRVTRIDYYKILFKY